MRFSLISLFLLAGCSSAYQSLVPAPGPADCLAKFKPVFTSELYSTKVDVIGKHISGLTFFKTTPEGSLRTVFMNEAGITFFDFEFVKDGTVKTHRVIDALNKKAVLRTLREDFELFLMTFVPTSVSPGGTSRYRRGEEIYYGFPYGKDTNYVITSVDCSSLFRVEKGTRRKKKTEVLMFRSGLPSPDSIRVKHYNFSMTIALKKLARD